MAENKNDKLKQEKLKQSKIESSDGPDKVYKILIVDDEKNELNALALTLRFANQFKSDIKKIDDPEVALEELHRGEFDLVLSDFNMPHMNGVEFLNQVKILNPDAIRLLITATPDYEIAKEAINKAEIDNFIEKPWYNEELREIIYNNLKKKANQRYRCSIKVDDSEEAINVLKVAKKNIFYFGNLYRSEHTIILEFNSADEFNKFYHEIQQRNDVKVEDMNISQDDFLIKVTIR
jgi:response regulator RpfG family c-di-GMP phosphodiesterase